MEIERRPCSTIGWRRGAPNPRLQPMALVEENADSDSQAHEIASDATDKNPIVNENGADVTPEQMKPQDLVISQNEKSDPDFRV